MLTVYIDASTKGNPGPSGGGLILIGEGLYDQRKLAISDGTNHEAEFKVFLKTLDILIENKYQKETIMLYTDSKIVAQTIDKNYTSNPSFQPFLIKIQEKLTHFELLMIQWIPETKNKGADNLARQALAARLKTKKTKDF